MVDQLDAGTIDEKGARKEKRNRRDSLIQIQKGQIDTVEDFIEFIDMPIVTPNGD